MARRPGRDKPDVLSKQELAQLRQNLLSLTPDALRNFYQCAFDDCRAIYHRLPSPRQMQTLVQVWKLLWKRRR
jgi:hypothetical protein